jgi:Uma2 family endonuclease
MATAAVRARYTPEQYLALERKAAYKSEYLHGRIYAMSGASRAHNLIALNIGSELRAQLKGRPCETYVGDMRVQVSLTGLYTYPDVSVACDEIRFEDAHNDTLLNPIVLIEVLAPSTEAYDRGDKFAHYRRLESLQEYVLIAQDKCRVERYLRQGDQWLLTEISDSDATLAMTTIACDIPLKEIYARVTFPEEPERESDGTQESRVLEP